MIISYGHDTSGAPSGPGKDHLFLLCRLFGATTALTVIPVSEVAAAADDKPAPTEETTPSSLRLPPREGCEDWD